MRQVLFPLLGIPASQDLSSLPALGPLLFQLHNCRVWKKSPGRLGITNRGGELHLSLPEDSENCSMALSSCQALLSLSVSGLREEPLNWAGSSRPHGTGLGFRKLWVFFLAYLRSLFTFSLVSILCPKFSLVEFGFSLLSQRRELKDNFHCPTLSAFSWPFPIYPSIRFFFFKQIYCPDLKMTKYRFEIGPKCRFLLHKNLFKRTIMTSLPTLQSSALSLGTKSFLPYSPPLGFFLTFKCIHLRFKVKYSCLVCGQMSTSFGFLVKIHSAQGWSSESYLLQEYSL